MGIEFDPGRRKFLRLACATLGATAAGFLLRSSGERVEKEPDFCWPIWPIKKGVLTEKGPSIGYATKITQGFWEKHKAVDIRSDEGTPVLAAADGIVLIATASPEITTIVTKSLMTWKDEEGKIRHRVEAIVERREEGLGQYVVILHDGGFETVYGHLKEFSVQEGNRVFTGDKIGEVGMTGQTTGPHLHFEMRKNTEPVNPFLFLDLNCRK